MVVYPIKKPLTGYHLRAKINMGYVWDGCVGAECENVCAQRWPIANWSSRFVTKFSFASRNGTIQHDSTVRRTHEQSIPIK